MTNYRRHDRGEEVRRVAPPTGCAQEPHLWILRAVTALPLAVLFAAACAAGGSSGSEAATRSEIEEGLRRDRLVERIPVNVRVDGNPVVLYGNVRTAEERRRAEEIALQTSGVRPVENHLRVAPGGGVEDAIPTEILNVPGGGLSP